MSDRMKEVIRARTHKKGLESKDVVALTNQGPYLW